MSGAHGWQHTALAGLVNFGRRTLGRRWLGEIAFFALVASLCGVLLCMFVREKNGLNANHKALFLDVIDGTAHRPYVLRVLVPWTVGAGTEWLGSEARGQVDGAFADYSSLGRALDAMVPGWDHQYKLEYLLTFGLMYAALVGFAYALRYLLGSFYRGPPVTGSDAAPSVPLSTQSLVVLFGLVGLVPFFETYASYVYDFPQLFLITLGLGAMARRQWALYLPVFALGCLNKETTILLGLVYALYFALRPGLRGGVYLGLGLVQLALFAGLKTWIDAHYALNPGGAVEQHLARNIMWLPRYSLGSLFAFLVTGLLIAHRWGEKPVFLRVALVMFVPLFGLTIFFGYLDELRDYYEVYPVALLLGTHSVAALLERPLSPLRG